MRAVVQQHLDRNCLGQIDWKITFEFELIQRREGIYDEERTKRDLFYLEIVPIQATLRRLFYLEIVSQRLYGKSLKSSQSVMLWKLLKSGWILTTVCFLFGAFKRAKVHIVFLLSANRNDFTSLWFWNFTSKIQIEEKQEPSGLCLA